MKALLTYFDDAQKFVDTTQTAGLNAHLYQDVAQVAAVFDLNATH